MITQVFCKSRLRLHRAQFIGEIDPQLAIHWAKQLFETEILNILDGSDSISPVLRAVENKEEVDLKETGRK